MARREDIYTAIYNEDDFLDLPADARWLYFVSFSNPALTVSGVYRVGLHMLMLWSGFPRQRFERALEVLTEARKLLYIDGVLFVRRRLRHYRQKGKNQATSVVNDLKAIDGHPLVAEFAAEYGASPWLREALVKAFPSLPKNPGPEPKSERLPQGSGKGSGRPHGTGTGVSRGTSGGSSSELPPRQGSGKSRSDVDELCALLAEQLAANGLPASRIAWPSDAWRREARLLLDRDGRDLEQAKGLVRWCQADSFWKANIHGIPSFRKQYDTLRQRAEDEGAVVRLADHRPAKDRTDEKLAEAQT